MDIGNNPVIQHIVDRMPKLTPKGRILGNYVVQHPQKVFFMTTKELAEACMVSEATVVRFVSQLGYETYGAFLQALRDLVNTWMTLQDRVDLPGLKGAEGDRLGRVMAEEMENMRQLYRTVDRAMLDALVDQLEGAPAVYVAGSRLSYTFAYYFGWSLAKVRKGVNILKGSDSTAFDRLNNAIPDALVVIVATSRYPNELIRLAKVTRRLGHPLFVIADSPLCPLFPFAHKQLVVPAQSIPYIGYIAAMSSMISYLVLELAARQRQKVGAHQEKLEQIYLENDILFNLPMAAEPKK
ncbi:MAG: MurR/RpiR family transcriptional regulator [Desulfosarcina sp.]|nr:MurR/RpiR family transcriptional regulator [Desulfobacterales bacterium]